MRMEDGTTITELARKHTPLAIKQLAKIAKEGESEAAIVAAATALLDRGWGRPRQAVDLTVEDVPGAAEALEAARLAAKQRQQPSETTRH
jgi:hypothetical protein